uniref:C2H2-type domain-containing protein n=1 Tax=Kalanchoe fedtschenkoi TaxID=63787 RepID=A0A7N0UIG5_KALFE
MFGNSKLLQALRSASQWRRVYLYHAVPDTGFAPSLIQLNPMQKKTQNIIGIFWDLDNKPPKSLPPYEAAVKLKKALSSFGIVRYKLAYANHHAFRYVPPVVREKRRERRLLNQLENKGRLLPAQPYLCRVCGMKFYENERLVNHFKMIHEREHVKRMSQIESAKGNRRVKLVGKYSMKMERYKLAAKDLLTPKVGYGLADEVKRAGFFVQTVSNKPQAADIALIDHMVEMMDRQLIGCVVLVSDDSDFVALLKEAKLRCLKTVVVGDVNDGALKRVADAAFSWNEIMIGKAKKEAVSVIGRWKDRDVLKSLEWKFNQDMENGEHPLNDIKDEYEDMLDISHGKDADIITRDERPWWKLDSEADGLVSE